MQLENAIHRLLVRRRASALRLAVGAVFVGFALLKYFPSVSPVEDLTARTIETLSLGLVSGWAALAVAATLDDYYQWRDRLLEGATEALVEDERNAPRRR